MVEGQLGSPPSHVANAGPEQKEDILPQHVRYRYGVPQDEALHTFDSIPSEDTRGDISRWCLTPLPCPP